MEKRTDPYLALLIDAVLDMAAVKGIKLSVAALRRIGAPADVAMRVLTQPRQRRTSVHPIDYAELRND